MKRISKFFVNILAVVMLVFATISMSACADVVTLEVTLQVYNVSESKMYEEDEVKLVIDLQRHLAPKTVNAIIDYVNDGYYNDTVFYLFEGNTAQIMVGDYKFDGTTVTQNTIKPQLEGEFEYGSTKGSNLVNYEGYIGLWRSWYAQDEGGYTYKASNGMDSGRSNIYIPLNDTLSDYDGYFCVFGTIDYTIESNDTGVNAVGKVLSDYSTTYVVYYTGEYDTTKPDENFGLQFHCVTADDYDDMTDAEKDEIFVAKGDQYVQYNMFKIKVPNHTPDGKSSAMIKSAKIK